MSPKKRVFQVAREYNISNEALIAFLTKLGYDIRNQMSTVADEALQQVAEKYGEKAVAADEEHEFRKRLRDKKVAEEAKKKEAAIDLERRLRVAQEYAKEIPAMKKRREAATRMEEAEHEKEAKLAAARKEEAAARMEETAEKPEVQVKRPSKRVKIVEIPPTEPTAKEKEKKREKEKEKEREKSKARAGLPKEEILLPTARPKPSLPPTIERAEAVPVDEEDQADKRKKRKRKKKKKVGAEEVVPAVVDKKHKRVKKKKKHTFNEEEIQASIRQTMASLEDAGKVKKKKRRTHDEGEIEAEEVSVIRVSEFMSVAELGKLMETEPSDLIKKCIEYGMMVSINQRLDMDTITLLASEYGYGVEKLQDMDQELLDTLNEQVDREEDLLPRPPVVTIMGHVDHGKTSLLDYIRKSNIIAGEAGGITQHIGAYEVVVNNKAITFLDTPGHEAFTAMRARGAQVTDIVILVVAADDSVMPQTIEAISHAKAANVPMVVAINKIDKPGANPEAIRMQLANHGVLVERYGGRYQSVEISAKNGQNCEQLLELILLEAEMLNLRANPNRKAKGVVIESRLDRGKGVMATVLVQNGTLKIGDPFVAGAYSGKVRSMFDERGRKVKAAGPSTPVQVLGFDGLPQAGDSLIGLESERDSRDISSKRQQLQREYDRLRNRPRSLDEISKEIQKGQVRQLFVVLKADVDGSIEAITDTLQGLRTEEVAVDIIHRGVGAISESDVLLASASGAIIIGFNVRPTTKARELAAKEHVDIRQYEIIYEIVNDIKAALEGFLAPSLSEELTATVEVRQIFKVPKAGIIAGCYVQTGKLTRSDKIKVYRDDRLIHDGSISSLRRFKDDVREVAAGFECGIGLMNYDDIKVNDVFEGYRVVETKRTLE
ncbi:MAG TPA: translation initiation factor IF-2 [bacterium]|nr:translation initiation factor IF-2 [bacterium]